MKAFVHGGAWSGGGVVDYARELSPSRWAMGVVAAGKDVEVCGVSIGMGRANRVVIELVELLMRY